MKLKKVAMVTLVAGIVSTLFAGCFKDPLPPAQVQEVLHPEFDYKLAQISETEVGGVFQKVLSLEFNTKGYGAAVDHFKVSLDGNAVDTTVYKGYVCADEHMNNMDSDYGYKVDFGQNTLVLQSDTDFDVADLTIEVNPYAIMDTDDVLAKPVDFSDWVTLTVNAEKTDMHLQQKFLHGQTLFTLNDNLYVMMPGGVDADPTSYTRTLSIVPLVGSLADLADYMNEHTTAVFGLPVYSYPAPNGVTGGAATKTAIMNLYNTPIPAPEGVNLVVSATADTIAYRFDMDADMMAAFEEGADVHSEACTNVFASVPSIIMPDGDTMVLTDVMSKDSNG